MTTDNPYEDLAMRLYWDCQELQGRLAEVEEDGRRAVLLSWLETQDGKYPVIPEFKPEYSWYNLSSRLTLDSLTGCLTLIDFFTYCCINCLHILPDLARLEQKYKVEPGGDHRERVNWLFSGQVDGYWSSQRQV